MHPLTAGGGWKRMRAGGPGRGGHTPETLDFCRLLPPGTKPKARRAQVWNCEGSFLNALLHTELPCQMDVDGSCFLPHGHGMQPLLPCCGPNLLPT